MPLREESCVCEVDEIRQFGAQRAGVVAGSPDSFVRGVDAGGAVDGASRTQCPPWPSDLGELLVRELGDELTEPRRSQRREMFDGPSPSSQRSVPTACGS